jgi:hypothetical protein
MKKTDSKLVLPAGAAASSDASGRLDAVAGIRRERL